jgi:outer membrane protein assembly factor BamB
MAQLLASLREKKRKPSKLRWLWWFIPVVVILMIIGLLFLFQCTDIISRIPEDVQSSPQAGEWAMFRRDLAHTGNAGTNNVSTNGTLKWTFATGGPIRSSPAVYNGRVYFGSRDGYIYALDADTGAKLWALQTGGWVDSSPVIVGGVVYCGSNDGNLYALDAATGAKRWSFNSRYGVRSSPAVADGVIYFGNDGYYVYALDAATGEQLWRADTGDMVTSSPAVSKGVVVVGSYDYMLHTFNAKTGSARLQLDTKSPVIDSPAVKDGVAYYVNSMGFFYAADITAKNWLWENKIRLYWNTFYLYGVLPKPSNPSGFLWGISLGRDLRMGSSPALDGSYAYVGAGANLVSVDITVHKVQWTFSTGGDVYSSPAVAGEVIYVGSEDGHLYAVDKATGLKLWDADTGAEIESSPAAADGMVYIGSFDGKLYAFE